MICANPKCNKEFRYGRSDKKYCSELCGKNHRSNMRRKRNPDRVREISRLSARKRYKNDPEKFREASKTWARNNPEKVKERWAAYYEPIRDANARKRYKCINCGTHFKSNPNNSKPIFCSVECKSKKYAQDRQQLTDQYIKTLLTQHANYSFRKVPKHLLIKLTPMIEVKRKHIQLFRTIKQQKHESQRPVQNDYRHIERPKKR